MIGSPNPFTNAILTLLADEGIAREARAWVVDQGAPDDTRASVRDFFMLQLEDLHEHIQGAPWTATAVALLTTIGDQIDWAAVDAALAGPDGYDWPEDVPASEPPSLCQGDVAARDVW